MEIHIQSKCDIGLNGEELGFQRTYALGVVINKDGSGRAAARVVMQEGRNWGTLKALVVGKDLTFLLLNFKTLQLNFAIT